MYQAMSSFGGVLVTLYAAGWLAGAIWAWFDSRAMERAEEERTRQWLRKRGEL